MKRLHLQVFGRVQGVGYRFNCYRQACSLGLTGWVRNLPDGSVEIMAEGPPAALNAFAAWCRKGPAFADVGRVAETLEPATGEFPVFDVKD
ncbi:MAG: acylphosphatase [Kiritimatiellia bacterium]|jgi:acylphosphatase|nr:acylphosphatase [Kiritimatiellia bacterium]